MTTRGDLLLEVPEQEACGDSQAVPAPSAGIGHWVPHPGDLVGVHEHQPGLFWIGVPLVAGRVSADQLRRAADLAERHGDGVVRFTVRQGLLLLNVPQEKVVNVLEGFQSVDLRPQGSMVRRGLVVCSETESCVEGWSDLSHRAREIVEHLEKQLLLNEPLRVRMVGRSCVCDVPAEEQILLRYGVGQDPEQAVGRWEVRVGGQLLAGGVPGDEVKFLLERLLVNWKRRRTAGELLNAFCARVGYDPVAQQPMEAA